MCGGDDLKPDEVLGQLCHLVDSSLVSVRLTPDAQTWYRLLDTVREYAAERLRESGEEDAVTARHACHFRALAEQARLSEWRSGQSEWMRRLETVSSDLRAALDWHQLHDQTGWVRMAVALGWFWLTGGRLAEGQDRLLQVLESAPSDLADRAGVLYALARLTYWHGDAGSGPAGGSPCGRGRFCEHRGPSRTGLRRTPRPGPR